MTTPNLSGPQRAALWRLPPAGADFAPRHRHSHATTFATLMQKGLIERAPDGAPLYRRTAAGDVAVARMPAIGRPAEAPLPLQGGA